MCGAGISTLQADSQANESRERNVTLYQYRKVEQKNANRRMKRNTEREREPENEREREREVKEKVTRAQGFDPTSETRIVMEGDP